MTRNKIFVADNYATSELVQPLTELAPDWEGPHYGVRAWSVLVAPTKAAAIELAATQDGLALRDLRARDLSLANKHSGLLDIVPVEAPGVYLRAHGKHAPLVHLGDGGQLRVLGSWRTIEMGRAPCISTHEVYLPAGADTCAAQAAAEEFGDLLLLFLGREVS